MKLEEEKKIQILSCMLTYFVEHKEMRLVGLREIFTILGVSERDIQELVDRFHHLTNR